MVAILKEPYPALRTMTAEDLEQVAAIELAAYEYPWTHGIFRDCLRAGYDCIVLAHGIEVVGYGVLSAAAGEAHVLNVCVAPAQHGHGHGTRLMQRLIDLARWHRAERIFLEVRPSNAHAIRIYDRLGFNEIGKRPNYYPAKRGREDAVVMAMELLPPE
ncbi:MAG: ribosomal protein S18-alanine N-acetyltransferase [Proteobacteria bacterium]|nr:ribosomal protein S18-alanine N-acetyltransferase [Pseudomonadota bacterium]